MNEIFILNPIAAKNMLGDITVKIKRKFTASCKLHITRFKGDAENISKTIDSDNIIFSVGGDGTFREIINGLAKRDLKATVLSGSPIINTDYADKQKSDTLHEKKPQLCIFPVGSGNDFARSVYGNLNFNKILEDYESLKPTSIDIGSANNEYFANIASIGFDAEIVKNSVKFKKIKLLRKFSYILSIFYTVFSYKGTKLKIVHEDGEINEKVLLLAVANGQYYGGGVRIAPFAEIDDGYFDICYIPMQHPLRILLCLPSLLNGSHTKLSFVKYFKAKSIFAQSTDEKPFLLNLDGDLFDETVADFKILPSFATILTDKRSL